MTMLMKIVTVTIFAWVTLGSPVQRSDDIQPLETVVQDLSSKVSTLQAKLTAVENTVTQLEARENQKIAFTASISEANVKAASGHIIPFSRIITNVGNAYDANTSTFTAPSDGQYMLFVNVDVSITYKILNIAKNGHSIIPGHNDGDDYHIYAGGVLTLKAGDEINIRHNTNAMGTVDGGPEAIFSGFKI